MLTAYGRVAQRITRLTTDQKIAGSNPAAVMLFFFCRKSHMPLCQKGGKYSFRSTFDTMSSFCTHPQPHILELKP